LRVRARARFYHVPKAERQSILAVAVIRAHLLDSRLIMAEDTDRFEQLWGELSSVQKKFIQAFIFKATKAEAAREVGISPSTVYGWDTELLDEVTDLLLDKRKDGLEEGIAALSPQAVDVLRRALDPESEVSRVEAESAQYIVNRLEGKPTQKKEVEMDGGIELDTSDEEALEDALSHFDEEEDDTDNNR